MINASRRNESPAGQDEFDDPHIFYDSSMENCNSLPSVSQDLEMNAVSVVPDVFASLIAFRYTFTIRQAVNTFGFGKFQAKLSLFTGLCWMADSMEMTILSILSPALHCEWGLTYFQQAIATTVVFLGMMISSTFWEHISEKYGRKKSLTLCAFLLLYYGIISSLAPTYIWVLILRGLVGFAIGCVPQSVTLYAEYLPSKQRSKCVVLLDCFWALGACFEVVLALLIMPSLGWKWLLALSTAPIFAFACLSPWLPESAKYQLTSGHPEKAIETLRKISSENNKPMLLGRLVPEDNSVESKGKIKDLLLPHLRLTTILLWLIWTSCAFCYYGVVLMTTELISSWNMHFKRSIVPWTYPEDTCSAQCVQLSTQDYMDLLWTTFAEFPGILCTIYVIEKFGHKKTIAIQFALFLSFLILLYIFLEKRLLVITSIFFARGIIAGVFQAAYVYTPEVYPSGLRSIGLSTCSFIARLGAMFTPYVAQVLLHSSLSSAIGIYGLVALMAATACSFLPVGVKTNEHKNVFS